MKLLHEYCFNLPECLRYVDYIKFTNIVEWPIETSF